jgi:hypothetical protein
VDFDNARRGLDERHVWLTMRRAFAVRAALGCFARDGERATGDFSHQVTQPRLILFGMYIQLPASHSLHPDESFHTYFSGTSCFNPFKDNELNGHSDMLNKHFVVVIRCWLE